MTDQGPMSGFYNDVTMQRRRTVGNSGRHYPRLSTAPGQFHADFHGQRRCREHFQQWHSYISSRSSEPTQPDTLEQGRADQRLGLQPERHEPDIVRSGQHSGRGQRLHRPDQHSLYQFDPNTGLVQNIAATQPQLVSNANFGDLQIGNGSSTTSLLAANATGGTAASDIDPAGGPHTTFTITGVDGPATFEFVTGPAASLPATGGQTVADGQTFVIGGQTFEFTEGEVLTMGGTAGSLDTQYDNQTLVVTYGSSQTASFEFVEPGQTPASGFTGITVAPTNSQQDIAKAIANAITTADSPGVTATAFTDSTGNQKVAITGATNIDPSSSPLCCSVLCLGRRQHCHTFP